ncbi:RluA family pseudouridine synthase [Aerococcaceae bacterium DSM 111176]|nr:RluA family pseudouridine synthase [Aerococcaceae bacterium DSM 111176]
MNHLDNIELHLTGQNGRLDKVLSQEVKELDLSRTQIQDLIKQDNILVDGKAQKANFKLQGTEKIEIFIPEEEPVEIEPEDIPLDIVYEDDDLLVVNKPAGMVVHPAKGHPTGTVVNALLYYLGANLSQGSSNIRPGIVHRIDKDTSGLMVVAKNDKSHQALSSQLEDRSLGRTYLALVNKPVDIPQGIIEVPIARDPSQRTRFTVNANGKSAYTVYEVIQNYENAALVKAELKTGRTHQIRVHFEYIGHPIVGDPTYRHGLSEVRGTLAKLSDGQYLHAHELHFIHPTTGEEVSVTAPLPERFETALDNLIKL